MEQKQLGEVTRYLKQRGYGWVSDANSVEHFFHVKNLIGHRVLGILPIPGDLVTFILRPSDRVAGRMEAYDVSIVRRAKQVQAPRLPDVDSDDTSKVGD